jgi:hypothetical protein
LQQCERDENLGTLSNVIGESLLLAGKLWLSRCLEWLEVVEKDKSHATAVVDVDKEILK